MSTSEGISRSAPHADAAEDEDLRATRWRQEQEISSLNETIVVYREGASALAEIIAELRHELVAARSLHTRTQTRGTRHEVEITLASDEDAPALVSLAVGEALEYDHSAEAVEAWQVVASGLADEAMHRHGTTSDVMLLLRITHSPTAVGVEILAD